MKHTLSIVIATTLIASVLTATAAFADNIVDKGPLGKYERQGRFLKPIMNPAPRVESTNHAMVSTNDGSVTIDKGAVAKYERQGRFVRPVVTDVQNSWASGAVAEKSGGVKHVHGLNGKEHKNVK
jgi:hypothetical protein